MYYSGLVEKEIELKLRTSGAIVVAGRSFVARLLLVCSTKRVSSN